MVDDKLQKQKKQRNEPSEMASNAPRTASARTNQPQLSSDQHQQPTAIIFYILKGAERVGTKRNRKEKRGEKEEISDL